MDNNLTKGKPEGNNIVNTDLFFRSLFTYNLDMVFFADKEGIIATTNKGFLDALGFSKEEIELRNIEEVFLESEVHKFRDLFNHALSGKIGSADTILIQNNGDTLQVNFSIIPALSENSTIGVFGIFKDITELKKAEYELSESELKFRSIVEEALVGVYIIEQDGRISYGNPKFHIILGRDFTEKLTIGDCIHPDDLSEQRTILDKLINGEEGIDHSFRMIRSDGSIIDVEAHSKKVYFMKNRPTIVGTLHDVTKRKKAEELNDYLAYHDSLTKLPNRRFLNEKLEQEILISKTLQKQFALMTLNVNRFKYVNDTLGHLIGDKLLIEFSQRIIKKLGDNDILTRVDGDEFVILKRDNVNTEQVMAFAVSLIKSIEEPFHIDNYELFVSASIGISFFPNDGEDYETIVKHTNSALYKAKSRGNSTYQIYCSSQDAETFKTFILESDLRKALNLNQLELYYQPKVCPSNNLIIGAEALIRWNHPEWGILYPNEFIPLAEETGLIIEIGNWTKKTVCIQNKTWQDKGLPAIPISINLSAHRFLDKEMLDSISKILEETKLAPEYLEIEILESSLLDNEKVVLSVLDGLREMGIRVSLDDFGTGYSSLSYLKKYNGRIDTLKIDRTFIKDLSRTESESSNFITKTITDLAHHLNMDVVAEGVETTEQLEILKEFNCNGIQGYLFSKPVPADEFAILLQESKINIEEMDGTVKNVTENRRKYFRINLDVPLRASMTIASIQGRKVELGKADVIIEDIGSGGLRFLSDIRLAVHQAIHLEFETDILGNHVKLQGVVVWMDEMQNQTYEYGVEFLCDEDERSNLTQLLNKFAIKLRKNPTPPDTSFVEVDKFNFFKVRNR